MTLAQLAQIIGYGGGGGLLILLTILQIAPIKINPWSKICNWFGDLFNHGIYQRLEKIETDVNDIKARDAERDAVNARVRILRFNDELLNNIDHSKDYYDQILVDIDMYEKYCEDHPKFKNNVTLFAISNIKDSYKACMAKHKFL
ncbi:MAG: hypothetical protein IKR19_08665 [Acholeplasmatales bacterium]|nr:hypothetical protein [Acholeplasmatales bacterium]